MSRAREFADLAGSADASGITGRNLIINGAAVIDQRNGGSAVNASGGNTIFPIDRFYMQVYGTSGNISGQQSTDTPSGEGFKNSLKFACVTADATVNASDQVFVVHRIEGNDAARLALGTSAAKSMTLSFWAKSNLADTFCVAFFNSAQNRNYVAEYTLSSSNTWEKIEITLACDTTGTWLTTNGIGLQIWFSLMAGSSSQVTANQWSASTAGHGTTNSANFLSSTSNELYITGIQLELGDTATPFEHRSYGDELARCQRYYEVLDVSSSFVMNIGSSYPGRQRIPLKVTKRASPTLSLSFSSVTNFQYYGNSCSGVSGSGSVNYVAIDYTGFSGWNPSAGGCVYINSTNTGSTDIYADAEL